MRPSYFSLLITTILISCLYTNLVWGRVDTLSAFPEKRFAGGVMALNQYLSSRIRYPMQAQQAAVVGTSLISFVVTPAGKLINVAVVNSLGNAIDNEVVRIIHETHKRWLPADKSESQDSIMLFLPTTFLLNNTTFYVEPFKPDFIMDELVVVAFNRFVGSALQDDDYYVAKLNSASQKKATKRMLPMINELIRRNPYSDQLYFQRAKIERELGLSEEACSDYKKIIYFLGRTSFPKQLLQNCP